MKANAEPAYLEIGRIRASHGVRGGMRVQILCDDPYRFLKLKQVFVGQDRTPFRVLEARLFDKQALLRLEGISTPEEVAPWREAFVFVSAADVMPLEPGEYYHHQILGLAVITDLGEELGKITDIIPTGSNDVYVVTKEQQEVLLPALKDVILTIDLNRQIMTVRIPEGLRD
ncbi:MAG: ribosome maturation factor RimM [Anaerolineae bacterium]